MLGTLTIAPGETHATRNIVELAQGLATSRTVHDCYALQWSRYALGRREATSMGLRSPKFRASSTPRAVM